MAAVVKTRGGSSIVYVLGFVGSVVYFWQQAGGFWEYVLAVLKALVWPALLTYEAFQALLG